MVRAANQTNLYLPMVVYEVTHTPTDTPTPTATPSPTVTPSQTPTPVTVPPYSTSFYVRTINPQTLYSLGCNHGKRDLQLAGVQDSVVVLDFGQPTDDESGYGANLFGYGPGTTAQIANAVEQFAVGYLSCAGTDLNSHLRIGIGTSNYGSKVYYMHGKAWAKMVNDVNHWIKVQGYFSRVDAVGASDMEISWNIPDNTRGWVDGYDTSNLYALYNYGDAAGCPTRSYPNWSCNPPWTREDVWYVSFGVGAAYPLPLIYSRDGGNAQQWALLSLYSYTQHGARMDIKGSFTQYQACQQFPKGCGTGLNNSPSQGWTQLKNELNRDSRTAQTLTWVTDIKWQLSGSGSDVSSQVISPGSQTQAEISQLQNMLEGGQVDDLTRLSLAEKLVIARQIAADQETERANPAFQTAAHLPTPSPVEDPLFHEGIFTGHEGLFHSGQMEIINYWQGKQDSSFIQVFAGAEEAGSQQGVLVLMTTSADKLKSVIDTYPVPNKGGAVRIIGDQDTQLILEAADGTQLKFDLKTKQFTNT